MNQEAAVAAPFVTTIINTVQLRYLFLQPL